jgi:hypothetical protein
MIEFIYYLGYLGYPRFGSRLDGLLMQRGCAVGPLI